MTGPGPAGALAVLGVRGLRVRLFRTGRLGGLVLRVCFVVCMTTTIVLGVAPPR